MTPEQQAKAIAELDGCSEPWLCELTKLWHYNNQLGHDIIVRPYLSSRDAIVPVIEKQPPGVKIKVGQIVYANMGLTVRYSMSFQNAMAMLTTPPSQLCEALLRATNRWIE